MQGRKNACESLFEILHVVFQEKKPTRVMTSGRNEGEDQQEIEAVILQGKTESMPYLSDLKQDQVLFK